MTYEQKLQERAERLAAIKYPDTYRYAKKMVTKGIESWSLNYYKKQLAYVIEMMMPLAEETMKWSDSDFGIGRSLAFNDLVDACFKASKDAGWHTDLQTGELLNRNKGEMLMLIVSEISEAMEGERKGLMDDKLPHRPMAEVELADAIIRICDYAGRWGYDLGGAVVEKLEYNRNREDHKLENRIKEGGKKW